jgi:hypothetical protein
MVIYNLYVVGVAFVPHEANTPLVIDTNAVLPFTVVIKCMKFVTRRHLQINQKPSRVYHLELAARCPLDVREPGNILIVKKPLGLPALKGLYHTRRI